MLIDTDKPAAITKGERTAQRILDVAEDLFATRGYDGTSLRLIAAGADIKEPGLYNHFAGKQALYEAVLFRALNPMAQALSEHMDKASSLREYTNLPSIITDLLLAHPKIASLFQRAMQGDSNSVGNQLMNSWLEKLFNQGMQSLEEFSGANAGGSADGSAEESAEESAENSAADSADNRATLALNLIAMFNLTTGYFLSQRAFAALAEGDLLEPENIARQKRLLHKVIRAMLIN